MRSHLPLAHRLAWHYAGHGEPLEDLVQVASLGLVKAARRYDPDRGHAFSTYAHSMITGELKRHLRDRCWAVHVPRHAKERALEVNRMIKAGLERQGGEPSPVQLAERLNLSENEVLDALEARSARFTGSLDAPALPDSGSECPTVSDTLGSPDRGYDQVEARLTWRAALQGLSTLDRRILYLRCLEDRSQRDIAACVGVSQPQVSRVLLRIARLITGTPDPGARNRQARSPSAESTMPSALAA